MKKDISAYSVHEKKCIEKTARRKLHSECILILTAGFAVLVVVFFFFGAHTLLPISEMIGVGPTVMLGILASGIAICWALLHFFYFRPKITAARLLSAELLYHHQEKSRLEREAKIQHLKNGN